MSGAATTCWLTADMDTASRRTDLVASTAGIAVASAVVSTLVAAALTCRVQSAQLVLFAAGAGGSALAFGLLSSRAGRWWSLVMVSAPLVYLVTSVWFWVSAAYYRWSLGSSVIVGPEDGMTLAATSWLPAVVVGASVYSASLANVERDGTERRGAARAGAKALAVAFVALPFVLQGVPEVVAPRLVQVHVVLNCHGQPTPGHFVDVDMAIQWVPSARDDEVDWADGQTIAMLYGQAISPL